MNADGSAWSRDIPIAVLVSEHVERQRRRAACRQRFESTAWAIVVGKHTAGSFAAAASRVPLQDGSILGVTVENCANGQGAQEIEGVGLEPDLTVDLDPAALAEGRDTQLEAALEYLKGKLGP